MNRDELIGRARELGCFPNPEAYNDQQLGDAIAAEEASIAWMAEWEKRGCPESAVQKLSKKLFGGD